MNKEYRYILASNKVKKLDCPYCGAKKHWQRYIDIETGEALPDQYGKCDNDNKCGEWNDPYKDGYAKAIWEQEQGNKTDWKPQQPKRIKKPVNKPKRAFIPAEVFNLTRAGYEQNTFIQNLLTRVAFPFEVQDIEKVISLYHLGTVQNGYRKGAITFPFIDIQNKVRAIQVKQFDEQNHTTGTDFLHSIIEKHHTRNNKPLPEWLEAYNKNETKVSCLFGEHLLNLNKYDKANIFLFEAPKTAIYSTLYFGFPEQTNILNLAVYNKSSFSFDKLKVLQGRFVYVFPDLSKDGNTFKEWETKAKEYESRLPRTRFIFSDLLERKATPQQREQGADIADVLILRDWRDFRKQPIQEQPPKPEPVPVETSTREKSEKSEAPNKTFFSQPEPLPNFENLTKPNIQNLTKPNIEQPQNWGNDIAELENYFAGIELPTQPIKLNGCSIIKDCSLFIESHFATVKGNNGKRTFLPYLNRLQELKQVLTINSN